MSLTEGLRALFQPQSIALIGASDSSSRNTCRNRAGPDTRTA